MPFRLFMLGLVFVLAYRLVRDVLKAVRSEFQQRNPQVRGRGKKPPLDLDESQIQDAEFQDIEA